MISFLPYESPVGSNRGAVLFCCSRIVKDILNGKDFRPIYCNGGHDCYLLLGYFVYKRMYDFLQNKAGRISKRLVLDT
jgi:hypothetical protein